MKIRTDIPLIKNQEKITKTIANFWNKTTEGWKVIWGPHIHHGFYENEKTILSPLAAQEKLIEELVARIQIKPGNKILDVGCGMGGSSIYLAKHYQAIVTGITLSQKQIEIAESSAKKAQVSNVSFRIDNALSLSSFADNSFDLIWSLESCEQFYDKALFIKQAYRVLKPGGQFLLATWCSDCDEYENKLAKKYQKLCLAFDLPYMPSMLHYKNLILKQGLILKIGDDWSNHVKKSWDIGISITNTFRLLQMIKLGGLRGFRFVRQLKLMQEGFQKGRVRYGVFVSMK